MNVLHWTFDATRGQSIRVDLDRQANVMLLDSHNFSNYRHGSDFSYRGGLIKRSPYILTVPNTGHWHVVVEPLDHVRAAVALI